MATVNNTNVNLMQHQELVALAQNLSAQLKLVEEAIAKAAKDRVDSASVSEPLCAPQSALDPLTLNRPKLQDAPGGGSQSVELKQRTGRQAGDHNTSCAPIRGRVERFAAAGLQH